MEVQSTAFNVFVEGVVDLNEGSDLWVSVPLANLFRSDFSELPEKEGYAERRFKVHLQMRQSPQGEQGWQRKLRFSKGRFYRRHGAEDERRARRRELRRERRARLAAVHEN